MHKTRIMQPQLSSEFNQRLCEIKKITQAVSVAWNPRKSAIIRIMVRIEHFIRIVQLYLTGLCQKSCPCRGSCLCRRRVFAGITLLFIKIRCAAE